MFLWLTWLSNNCSREKEHVLGCLSWQQVWVSHRGRIGGWILISYTTSLLSVLMETVLCFTEIYLFVWQVVKCQHVLTPNRHQKYFFTCVIILSFKITTFILVVQITQGTQVMSLTMSLTYCKWCKLLHLHRLTSNVTCIKIKVN